MANTDLSLYGLDWAFVLSCVGLLTWAVVLAAYIISAVYGKTHFHKPITKDDEKGLELPGVTIAKPLNSLADCNLVDNLSTFFTLDYPKYEIIFCIQDEDSIELIEVITQLMAKFPTVDAQMRIGAQKIGVNPKVNNMVNAYECAKYPLFLISDAGIRMKTDTLTDMVQHMKEKVGLVHQLPRMMDGDQKFSRVLEQVYFGGAHGRFYISANACGINCMSGMSCIFRKKILDEEGGMKSLSCYLGEDFFLSQLIINKGWRVALSSQPAEQNPGISSISGFTARMMRWMYMRFATIPQFMLLEPLTEHIFLGPFASLSAQYIYNIPFYIFLPVHFTVWCLLDYLLCAIIENRKPTYSIFSHIRAWIVRELLLLYLLPQVLAMRYVTWGGQQFKMRYGGKTEKAPNGDKHSKVLKL